MSPASCSDTAPSFVSGELVPVTCIPTAIPVVLAIVTVREPSVVVPERDTTGAAPQFVPMVNVCAPDAFPSPLKISSKAVLDNLHPA